MFFSALLSFVTALSYRGLENNFLADNWEVPLIVFLILAFALGWGAEGFVERILMNSGRQMALFVFVILLLFFGLIELGSFLSAEFTRYALGACGYILFSGFFYRFSVMRPEVMTRFRSRE
jgi:hypothetical protein